MDNILDKIFFEKYYHRQNINKSTYFNDLTNDFLIKIYKDNFQNIEDDTFENIYLKLIKNNIIEFIKNKDNLKIAKDVYNGNLIPNKIYKIKKLPQFKKNELKDIEILDKFIENFMILYQLYNKIRKDEDIYSSKKVSLNEDIENNGKIFDENLNNNIQEIKNKYFEINFENNDDLYIIYKSIIEKYDILINNINNIKIFDFNNLIDNNVGKNIKNNEYIKLSLNKLVKNLRIINDKINQNKNLIKFYGYDWNNNNKLDDNIKNFIKIIDTLNKKLNKEYEMLKNNQTYKYKLELFQDEDLLKYYLIYKKLKNNNFVK